MKNLALFIVLAIAAGMAPIVNAAETTFIPTPSADMWDLDHYRYYTWGVDLGFNTSETPITEAVLTFSNIRNWNTSANVLYIHLLDDGVDLGGLVAGADRRASGDYFAANFTGDHVLVDAWVDETAESRNLVYDFSAITLSDGRNLLAVLNEYGADGRIGFGFDPDCHYFNDGISFTVTTADLNVVVIPIVPAPGAILLAGIGTTVVGWLRRRRSF